MTWSPKTFVSDEEQNNKDDWTPKSFEADDESQSRQSGLLNTILETGGTAGRALGYGLGDIINTPIVAGDYLNKKVAALFGVKPENVPTPQFFNASQLSMPFVSKEREEQLNPIARSIATGAEYLPILGAGASLAKIGGSAALKQLARATNLNAGEQATDFMKSLIGNQPRIKGDFQNEYKVLGKGANERGYNDTKPIDAQGFSNRINSMDEDDKKAFLKNLSSVTKDKLKQFGNEPTYENAHDLQSMLGREGINAIKNRETAMAGRSILDIRNDLNQDITNNFINNGDTDLAAMRQDISRRYAENENKLLLANRLKPGAEDLPIGGLKADARQILSGYGKQRLQESLGRPQAKLATPDRNLIMANIQKSLARQDIARKLEKVLRWPVGGAIGGAVGIPAYHYIRELF